MGKRNAFIGGAAAQKELQGFAAFVAYQDVVNRGVSMTNGTLEQVIGDTFFGDPTNSDSIGLVEQRTRLSRVLGCFMVFTWQLTLLPICAVLEEMTRTNRLLPSPLLAPVPSMY
jgi:hypothetical protein